MAWKHFVGPRAITSRRRVVATAVMYGLSLTVRFTSATGEEIGNSGAGRSKDQSLISIMIMTNGFAQLEPAQPIVFRHGWPPNSRCCQRGM